MDIDRHSWGCPWTNIVGIGFLAGFRVGCRYSMPPAALVTTLASGPVPAENLSDYGGNMHLAAVECDSTVPPAAGKDHGKNRELVVLGTCGDDDDGGWQVAAFADFDDPSGNAAFAEAEVV